MEKVCEELNCPESCTRVHNQRRQATDAARDDPLYKLTSTSQLPVLRLLALVRADTVFDVFASSKETKTCRASSLEAIFNAVETALSWPFEDNVEANRSQLCKLLACGRCSPCRGVSVTSSMQTSWNGSPLKHALTWV